VRFLFDYFPFVEPGVEVSIGCSACDGTGCRLCGYSGWIEILGAGMVHPDVLSRVDIDRSSTAVLPSGWGLSVYLYSAMVSMTFDSFTAMTLGS